MAGLTQARWPSWPLLRRAESASREGDALPRPSFRGCLFGSSLLHRAPPPDKQAAARPEAGLLARPAKVACSCDHGASHAGAAATRVSFSGFWSPSRATPPLSEPELGCQSWASSARRRPPRSTQCRLASKASTGGHEGRWKMEAQAAEPSLRAHRRPPERPEGSAAP